LNRRIILILLLSFVVIMAGCAKRDEGQQPPPAGGSEIDINAIVAQWVDSNHANIHLVPAQRDNCVVCHDGGAFSAQLTQQAEIDRDFFVAIDCRACHNGRGVELMEAGTVSIPTKENVQGGLGAMCMSCHNARRVPDINDARRSSPHSSAQSDVFTASGGIRAPGFNYGSTAAHTNIDDTCVGCHMTATEDGYRQHTFRVEDAAAACGRCHQNINTLNLQARNDYDGDGSTEGIQDEVQGLLDVLKAAINEVLDGGSFQTGGGQVQFLNAAGEQVEVPNEVYQAGYNYFLVYYDGSLGVHNPMFAVQLLQQSYKMLTGDDVPGAEMR